MKKIAERIICLALAVMLVAGLGQPIPAKAEGLPHVLKFECIGKTSSSLTFQISAENCTSYNIKYNEYGNSEDSNSFETTETTFTISDLKAGTLYEVNMSGNNEGTRDFGFLSLKTGTSLINVTGVHVNSYMPEVDIINFGWDYQSAAKGFQYQLCDLNGKVLEEGEETFWDVTVVRKYANHAYIFKVRAFNDEETTDYVEILAYQQPFVKKGVTFTTLKQKGKKVPALKVAWNKNVDACGYDIYVSTDLKYKSFKKFKSVGKNVSKVYITKCGKKKISKKKNYYVFVVSKVKYNGKVTKSGIEFCWKVNSGEIKYDVDSVE